MILIGLGLHFILELCALAAVVYWGFATGETGWEKVVLGIGLALIVAAAWGIFRVPNDPGPATVAIPGPLRLALELLVLGGAAALLWAAGRTGWAAAFALAIAIDYGLMFERVRRLIRG